MRRFIFKISISVLPILLVGLLMEILLRQTPNDYKLKKQYLDKNASSIETLILGSSHAFYGIDPKYFSSHTFNTANISQSLDFDYKLFNAYKNKLEQLKTIVLPISYFSLFDKLEDNGDFWRIKNYILYYDIEYSGCLTCYSEVLSNKFDLNVERLLSHYMMNSSVITSSKLGWGTNYSASNTVDLLKSGKVRSKGHTKDDINLSKHKTTYTESLDILNHIVAWCVAHDISIIFFTPPAYKTYSENLDAKQLNKTIEAVTKIASQCNTCSYINLLKHSTFNKDDFFDADHLSKTGAKKLSLIIDTKIKALKPPTHIKE